MVGLATRPGPDMPRKRGARKPLRKSAKAQGLENDRCQRFGELERGVSLSRHDDVAPPAPCQRFGELERGVRARQQWRQATRWEVPTLRRAGTWCHGSWFGVGTTGRSLRTGANASESWNVVSHEDHAAVRGGVLGANASESWNVVSRFAASARGS